MKTNLTTYKRHRFPPEIIQHAVWLYFRFNLSHRDIEDLLAKRGSMVSYEAIRLGAINLDRLTQDAGRGNTRDTVILSLLMKFLSRLMESGIIYGGRLIRTAKLLMCFYKRSVMVQLRSAFSIGLYGNMVVNPGRL